FPAALGDHRPGRPQLAGARHPAGPVLRLLRDGDADHGRRAPVHVSRPRLAPAPGRGAARRAGAAGARGTGAAPGVNAAPGLSRTRGPGRIRTRLAVAVMLVAGLAGAARAVETPRQILD